jgi:hypothetical protein
VFRWQHPPSSGADLDDDGDVFSAERPPPHDASPIERLVAFSGRDI